MHYPSSSTQSHSRGQLILIGGIIIATILVILVLILNGVMYTENMATKDQPQAIDRAGNTLQFTENITTEAINAENRKNHQTEGETATHVNEELDRASSTLNTRRFETHGELTRVTTNTIQNAWVITQQENNEFTAAGQQTGVTNTGNWTMVISDGIRNGELTVSSAPSFNQSAENQADSVFQLTVTGDSGTGDEWVLLVYENPSTGVIEVTDSVDSDGNPDTERACEATTSTAEITLNPLRVDGSSCSFEFGDTLTTGLYEVKVTNGELASGTYSFVFGKGNGASLGENSNGETFVSNTMDGDSPDSTSPTAYDGVYSVDAHVSITGEDVDLESSVFVAPNQPDNTQSNEAQQ